MFKRSKQIKKKFVKNSFCRGDFSPFRSKSFLNLRLPLSITFPQGFQTSKKFGHWTLGSGGKKTVRQSENVILKVVTNIKVIMKVMKVTVVKVVTRMLVTVLFA